MKASVTVRLGEFLARLLEEECRRSGRSRAEVVRDALRRQLAIRQFDALREQMVPTARERGYATDEDVFRVVS